MLTPIAIASGIAIASAGSLVRQLVDCLVATILGAGLATMIFCFTAGALTPIESHERILPAFTENRVLLLALMPLMGLTAFVVLSRSKNRKSIAAEEAN